MTAPEGDYYFHCEGCGDRFLQLAHEPAPVRTHCTRCTRREFGEAEVNRQLAIYFTEDIAEQWGGLDGAPDLTEVSEDVYDRCELVNLSEIGDKL